MSGTFIIWEFFFLLCTSLSKHFNKFKQLKSGRFDRWRQHLQKKNTLIIRCLINKLEVSFFWCSSMFVRDLVAAVGYLSTDTIKRIFFHWAWHVDRKNNSFINVFCYLGIFYFETPSAHYLYIILYMYNIVYYMYMVYIPYLREKY